MGHIFHLCRNALASTLGQFFLGMRESWIWNTTRQCASELRRALPQDDEWNDLASIDKTYPKTIVRPGCIDP